MCRLKSGRRSLHASSVIPFATEQEDRGGDEAEDTQSLFGTDLFTLAELTDANAPCARPSEDSNEALLSVVPRASQSAATCSGASGILLILYSPIHTPAAPKLVTLLTLGYPTRAASL